MMRSSRLRRSFASRWSGLCPAMLAVLVASGCSNTSVCPTDVVDTTSGAVCGFVESVVDLGNAPVDSFRGIPFAETTAGENRWQPPIPKARTSGVFDASASGPACPQTIDPPFGPTSGTSEDCLSLNVWRPTSARDGASLPVMVWIYGGSFTNGGTSVPVYDGGYLSASADIVVVTLNYRLGALGFLAGVDGLAGNYGLEDQQLALQWVQDNIAGFGGDPSRVMIFGESAGAMSVGLHTLSIPSSAGLFRASLMESNPFGIPYKTVAQATTTGAAFVAQVGCAGQGIECLRALPADQIVSAQSAVALRTLSLLGDRLAGFLVFPPVIDGSFLVQDPTQAAPQGKLTVPTLLGTNHDEGTLFIAEVSSLFGGQISATVYRQVLALIFGAQNVPSIIALYGINETGNNFDMLSQIANDYLFGCANRYVASQARSSIFNYEFNETSLNIWQGVVPQCDGQACHGDEVPFVFHADTQIGITFTPEQARLSDQMVGYWTSFGIGLDPNHAGELRWPPFTPTGLEYLIFNTPVLTTQVNPIANCDFWDQIGYELNMSVFESMASALASEAR